MCVCIVCIDRYVHIVRCRDPFCIVEARFTQGTELAITPSRHLTSVCVMHVGTTYIVHMYIQYILCKTLARISATYIAIVL